MSRRQPDLYTGFLTTGIDVSRWQQDIDWDKVVSSHEDIKFVFIRTGDGRSKDTKFEHNWKEARRVGLLRGSYHYLRADRDGKYQAELVLKTLEQAGGFEEKDLPPALDLEGGANKNLPGGLIGGTKDLPIQMVVEECLEFLEVIESELGVLPLIYTGQAFHWLLSQKEPHLAEHFAKYPLWTPDYRRVSRVPADASGKAFPWDHWTFWQYTAKGKVDGISTLVDMNLFRGDFAKLTTFIQSLHKPTLDIPIVNDRDAILEEMKALTERLLELHNKLNA